MAFEQTFKNIDNVLYTDDKTAIFRFMKDASDKMPTLFAKYIVEYK